MEGTPRGLFPNELWQQMFEHLRVRLQPFKRTQRHDEFFSNCFSLAKLARVNKNFNAMATPLLYHTLPISSKFLSREKLALTLITRPDLTQMVREADIVDDSVPLCDQVRTLDALLEKCSTCSKHLRPFFVFLRNRVRQRRATAEDHIAIFLYLLTNLRVVELEVIVWPGPLNTIFNDWPGSILSRIEEVRLRNIGMSIFESNHGLVPLTEVSSIRTCFVKRACWKDFQWQRLPLRHMVLTGHLCCAGGFQSILSKFAHLSTLKIDPGSRTTRQIDFSAVGKDLRRFGQGLDELDLGPAFEPERFTGALGSLITLASLKELSIPWDIMAKNFAGDMEDVPVTAGGQPPVIKLIDQLPSSLEHLSLYLDSVRLQNWQLVQIIHSDRLSRLQSVRVTRRSKLEIHESRQVAFRRGVLTLGWDVRNYTERIWNSVDDRFQYEWMALEKIKA